MPAFRPLEIVRLRDAAPAVGVEALGLGGDGVEALGLGGDGVAFTLASAPFRLERLPLFLPDGVDVDRVFREAVFPPRLALDSGACAVAVLRDVSVDAGSSLLFTERTAILDSFKNMDPASPETVRDIPLNWTMFPYLSAFLLTEELGEDGTAWRVLAREDQFAGPVHDLPAVLLRNRSNYYHWLCEDLPVAHHLRDLGLLPEVDVCLAGAPLPFQIESLRALGVAAERIRTIGPGPHRFRCFVMPTLLASAAPVAPRCLEYARALADGGGGGGRLLYVSRDDAATRRVANEAEVLNALRPLGVERVTTAGMSLADQIALFRSARLIMGPHGAGLTNIAFASRATLLELSPVRWNPCFWYVAASVHRPYAAVFASGELRPWRDYHPSLRSAADPVWMRFDPARVRAAVERCLG